MDLPTIHLVLRTTARISFVLFLAAFAGPGLYRVWRNQASALLACHRDRFLLLFVASHTVHLAFVITLVAAMGWTAFLAKFTWATVVIGGSTFVLIYCLALDAAFRLAGSPRSLFRPAFTSFALYEIWTIFALAFVPRATPRHPLHMVLGIAALLGLIVRIAGRRARSAAASSASAA